MREKKTEHVSLRAPAFLRRAAERDAKEDGRTVSFVLCRWAVRGFAGEARDKRYERFIWRRLVARLPKAEK